MTRAILLATCISAAALFAGAPAFAEDQTPPAVPAAAAAPAPAPSEAQVPPALRLEQEGARPTAQRSTRAPRTSRMNADARHCLDLKTNAEVIKCAERYL